MVRSFNAQQNRPTGATPAANVIAADFSARRERSRRERPAPHDRQDEARAAAVVHPHRLPGRDGAPSPAEQDALRVDRDNQFYS